MSTAARATLPRTRWAVPVLARSLRDSWRGQLGWSLAITAVLGLYLPLFPSLQSPALTKLLSSLPRELVQTLGFNEIASGPGYTQATFFGLLGFALAAIASISWGTALIASAEESGRLELVLAHGIGRAQYAVECAAALLVRVAALGAVAMLVILVLNGPSELKLSAAHLSAAILAWTGLGFVLGATALAAGAAFGLRSWAIGAGTAVAVVGYGLDALGRTNAAFDWLWWLSPYHWAFGGSPLQNGFDWSGLGLLWGTSAALVGVSVWALTRRDILG